MAVGGKMNYYLALGLITDSINKTTARNLATFTNQH